MAAGLYIKRVVFSIVNIYNDRYIANDKIEIEKEFKGSSTRLLKKLIKIIRDYVGVLKKKDFKDYIKYPEKYFHICGCGNILVHCPPVGYDEEREVFYRLYEDEAESYMVMVHFKLKKLEGQDKEVWEKMLGIKK